MTCRLVVALLALAFAPGCLVLSVHPAYDGDTMTWEPGLLGTWQDADDRSSMEIERGEWKSYKIRWRGPLKPDLQVRRAGRRGV